MTDPLLDLLDQGLVREALGLVGDRDDAVGRILAGWRKAGLGDPLAAARALRPLVAELEADPAAARTHAHAVLALGVSCVMGGEGDAGMALLERALTLHTAAWPRAQALRYCALALEHRGAWEGAASRYEAAAGLYAEIGHLHGRASALYGAATALGEQGDPDRGWPLIRAAVEAFRSQPPGPALGAALGQLATLAIDRDDIDPEGVLPLLTEAEDLTKASGMYAWDVLLRRGEVLLRMGRPQAALGPLEDARRRIPPTVNDLVWADHLLAQARLDLGHPRDAEAILARTDRDGLSGAALLERSALRLCIAAATGDTAGADRALDLLERGVRARWRRRGVDRRVREAARTLARAKPSANARITDASGDPDAPRRAERAARAWQVAVALGPKVPPDPDFARDLRSAGARIPLGPLWLEARIGRGGMGDVWRATHRSGGQVAVKLVRGGGRAQAELFDAEMRAVARLDHPGVVRVLAALRVDPVAAAMLAVDGTPLADGGRALVMELVSAGSLEDRAKGWDWPSARALLLDVLAALGHAHARGVLHLDIKPGNVLLDRVDGAVVPRLTDFGLAGLARNRRGLGPFGTPAYMAPEQASPGAPLGPATDLYAFGCLAWWLLTERVPLLGATVAEQVELLRRGELPAFKSTFSVPAGLEGWLRGLLARAPEQRFPCAADAAAALLALEQEPIAAPPVSPEPEVPTPDPGTLVPGGSGPSLADPVTVCLTEPGEPALPRVSGDGSPAWRPSPHLPGSTGERPARGAHPPAPFPSDWRGAGRRDPSPFLWGVGEGLFEWRRGRLVGRDAEQDALWAALGRVHAGEGAQGVWITSPAGLGRTAILEWLAETALAAGAAWTDEPGDDRPHLLLLDDPAPAQAERTLAGAEGSATLVVVASAALPPLGFDPLVLDPLSPSELRVVLDERLPLDRALAAALVTRAGGSPAFAVALLADLLRRDALEPGPEGFRIRTDAEVAVPDDLRSLWTVRLDALAPQGSPRRSAWEITALAGDPPLALLDAAWARAGLGVDRGVLDPLLEEGWVVLDDGDTVHFRAPAAREALVGAANATGRLPTWSAVLAEALPPEHPDRGRHLAAAGRHAEALGFLRLAARNAVNATRLEECRALLDLWDRSADALGLAADDPRRASPLVVRVHLALHTQEDPYPLLDRGLAIATGDIACQLAYTLGWALAQDGRHAEAEVAYVQAIGLAEALGLGDLRVVSRLGLAASRYALGHDAGDLLADVRRSAGPELLVRADACEGRGLLRIGRDPDAEPILRAAVLGAHGVGAPDVEAEARCDLAILLGRRGDTAGEIAELQEALTVLGTTGSDKALRVRARLATALARAGRRAEARVQLAAARRFGWRSRPADAAELAAAAAVVDG